MGAPRPKMVTRDETQTCPVLGEDGTRAPCKAAGAGGYASPSGGPEPSVSPCVIVSRASGEDMATRAGGKRAVGAWLGCGCW